MFCCRPDVKVAKIHSSSKRKKSQKHHFLWVSEVTLGIFGVQFWGFSVLQRHGDSLPGGDFFHGVFPSGDQHQQQQQKPLQQQAEKVAKIHTSSKRKKRSQNHHVLAQMIFFEPVPLKVFMLRATEADKKVGTGRLLLLCMPYRSAAHAAIGLFVFALDSPKFYGALDAGSTSRACVRKVIFSMVFSHLGTGC